MFQRGYFGRTPRGGSDSLECLWNVKLFILALALADQIALNVDGSEQHTAQPRQQIPRSPGGVGGDYMRSCRIPVYTQASIRHNVSIYWRMGPEACSDHNRAVKSVHRRRLQQHDDDCGEVKRWLALLSPDVEELDWLESSCQQPSGFRCMGRYVGGVQAIDTDECGLENFLERSAGKVQVVERDAEMQVIPWEEQGWPSSRSGSINATRRSNEDLELSGLQESVLPWHLDRIDQRYMPLDKMYTYANTASNVHIYVIDTGVYGGHVEFQRGGGSTDSRVEQGYAAEDVAEFADHGQDCTGHGTACAGAAGGLEYGTAKGATIIPVRVTDCRGRGTQGEILDGLSWIKSDLRLPAVVSMSLGVPASELMDSAVLELINAGAIVIAAAGNSGKDACEGSPARVPAVITVAASDRLDNSWVSSSGLSSNWGECVDINAPGEFITSAGLDRPDHYQVLSGTSLACPLVAGVVAQYLQVYPRAGPVDVSNAIKASATPSAVNLEGAVGTTASMINSWSLIPEDRHELDPYGILKARENVSPTTAPQPEQQAPPSPTPQPTAAPTPAPTLGTGHYVNVTEPINVWEGALRPYDAQWYANIFGIPVIGMAPCTEEAVQLAAGTLAHLLDRDSNDVPENLDLLDALVNNKALLLLYGSEQPPEDLAEDLRANGTVVAGLQCLSSDLPFVSSRNLAIGHQETIVTWQEPLHAALALMFEAGYSRMFPDKISPSDPDSLLWMAIEEANADCGFVNSELAKDYGFQPFCNGIFAVFDAACGRACAAVRYFVLAYITLMQGFPKGANGQCGQPGVKWSACSQADLQKTNKIGAAVLSDASMGLPVNLYLSGHYFGTGELPPSFDELPLPLTPSPSQTPTPSPTPTPTPTPTQTPDVLTRTPSPTQPPTPAPTPAPTEEWILPEESVFPPTLTPAVDVPDNDLHAEAVVRLDGIEMAEFLGLQAEFVEALSQVTLAQGNHIFVLGIVKDPLSHLSDGALAVRTSFLGSRSGEGPPPDNYVDKLMQAVKNGTLKAALARYGLVLHKGPEDPVTRPGDCTSCGGQRSSTAALAAGLTVGLSVTGAAAAVAVWWMRQRAAMTPGGHVLDPPLLNADNERSNTSVFVRVADQQGQRVLTGRQSSYESDRSKGGEGDLMISSNFNSRLSFSRDDAATSDGAPNSPTDDLIKAAGTGDRDVCLPVELLSSHLNSPGSSKIVLPSLGREAPVSPAPFNGSRLNDRQTPGGVDSNSSVSMWAQFDIKDHGEAAVIYPMQPEVTASGQSRRPSTDPASMEAIPKHENDHQSPKFVSRGAEPAGRVSPSHPPNSFNSRRATTGQQHHQSGDFNLGEVPHFPS